MTKYKIEMFMAYKFIRTAARLAVPAAMFLTLTNIPSTAAHVAHGSVTFVDKCIYNVTLDNPNSIVTIEEEGGQSHNCLQCEDFMWRGTSSVGNNTDRTTRYFLF